MKLHVLEYGYNYEGRRVLGVYSTRALAEAAEQRDRQDNSPDYYEITEFEVNAGPRFFDGGGARLCWGRAVTRDQFIDMYCAGSRMTREHLLNWRRVLPCYCGDDKCLGWATVLPEDEEHHMKTDGVKPE